MSYATELAIRSGLLLPVAEQTPENLPFTIRVVRDNADLHKAIGIRQAAYERHVPEFASTLGKPESDDLEPGSVVLLAESKMDGEPLGTMRIQTNMYGPLGVEHSTILPAWLKGHAMSEASRLGVSAARIGRVAKTAMFKAFYLFCVEAGIEWMVITARSPVDRQYEQLMFQDVFPGQGYIPMEHVGNIPHRVLAFEIATAEKRWREHSHPLYNFVFRTHHPDIQIDGNLINIHALQSASARADEFEQTHA